MLRFTC